MAHVPAHIPAAAAAEHAVLIVALDAGDLEGLERRRGEDLARACPGCASLRADLATLRAATATLAAPPRTRDYRLTDADAERLRPSAWRQMIGWLGSPRSTVRPLAGGLAALGIVGLLLTTTPGIFGQATTLSTSSAPAAAPSTGTTAGGSPGGIPVLGVTPNIAAGPGVAATAPPAASPAFAVPASSPRGAAPPLPSLAAAALPSAALPSAAAGAGVLTGPAAPAPAPSAGSIATGAMDSGAKAGAPEASGGERNASLSPGAGTPAPDRTLPLLISLVLLAVGVALLLTNRVLRRRDDG